MTIKKIKIKLKTIDQIKREAKHFTEHDDGGIVVDGMFINDKMICYFGHWIEVERNHKFHNYEWKHYDNIWVYSNKWIDRTMNDHRCPKTKDIIDLIDIGDTVFYKASPWSLSPENNKIKKGVITGFGPCKHKGNTTSENCTYCKQKISIDNRDAKCMYFNGEYCCIILVENEFIKERDMEL